MKYIKTSLLSFLVAVLFAAGMIISVSADEDDVPDESSFFEESSFIESSIEESSFIESSIEESSFIESSVEESSFIESSIEESSFIESSIEESSFIESSIEESSFIESSIEESSFIESSIEESSFIESSIEESSFIESSIEESSFIESSIEENSAEESSEVVSGNEESRIISPGQSSIPEFSMPAQPVPKNDPLRWMADIKVILPADRQNGNTEQSGSEEVSYILPPAEPEDDEEKLADLSTVPAEPVNETPTSINAYEKKDTKTQFLIGIIIFSAIGMVLTLSLILYMRSKRERSILFKRKNKK